MTQEIINYRKWTLLMGWGSWDAKFKSMDFYEWINAKQGALEIKEQKQGQQALFPVDK